MKNYLKCPLTEEETDLINGMIWRVAKTYKLRQYQNNLKTIVSIDDVELLSEDKYDYTGSNTIIFPVPLRPYTNNEKEKIVESIDSMLTELLLNDLKEALTFEEKLVLFLYYFHKYMEKDIVILLGISKRTITNRKKSIKDKKIKILGGN